MLTNLKKYTSLVVVSTLLAGFSLGSIISFTDPGSASWVVLGFFYLSLFLFSFGVFSLIGLGLRQTFWSQLYILNLTASFRQGALVAILIVVSFILLSQGLMYWWVELSLILFLAAIEGFFNLKL